jgi:transcription antitermination factor NusG
MEIRVSRENEVLGNIQTAPVVTGTTVPPLSPHESVRHWYAVYTRPCHEAQVARHFDAREIEAYLPCYQVVHRWKNRCTRKLDLPLFPRYIFAHVAVSERVRVLQVPGVLLVVGSAGKPTPLPHSEIELIRGGLHARKAEPHPFLKVGQRARIRSGAMAGLEGVVVRGKNSLRVVISLDLIRQSVALEVDWDELESLPMAPARLC